MQPTQQLRKTKLQRLRQLAYGKPPQPMPAGSVLYVFAKFGKDGGIPYKAPSTGAASACGDFDLNSGRRGTRESWIKTLEGLPFSYSLFLSEFNTLRHLPGYLRYFSPRFTNNLFLLNYHQNVLPRQLQ